jgi:hypothetical protein
MNFFFRHVCKIADSDYQLRHVLRHSVRLSVRMEQLDSHWADFHEIWYLSIFRKYVEKIRGSLKYGKNNRYLMKRSMYMYDHISLNSSSNGKFLRKLCRENRNTNFIFNNLFRKSCLLWDNVENMAQALCVLDT